MSSTKRKALESQLQRRVRARRDLSEEAEVLSEDSAPSLHKTSHSLDGKHSDNDMADSDSESFDNKSSKNDETDSSSDLELEPEAAASISFGALAKAQAGLQKQGKVGKVKQHGASSSKDDAWEDNEALERKAGRKDHRAFSRSSKHAPTEMSSKKAVSRRREAVPVAKREYRDPRFEPLSGPVDESKFQRAYSFLDDYREDEMKELKLAIKKTRDQGEKEKLKRALLSMESKKKAQERKRREQEILDKHRKEEKELVKHGKQPFYLKKAEQQKRVLVEQFSGMSSKQMEHAVERRRKKQDAKEKKKMPWVRREVQ